MRKDDLAVMGLYALGAAVLSWLGVDLWGVSQVVAVISATGAALCFAIGHVLFRLFQPQRAAKPVRRSRPAPVAKIIGTTPEIDEAEAPQANPFPATPPTVSSSPRPGAIVSLRDRRTRHIALDVDDGAELDIKSALELVAQIRAKSGNARAFLPLSQRQLDDSSVLRKFVDARQSGAVVIDVAEHDAGHPALALLAAAGYEICVRLTSSGALFADFPGTLRKLPVDLAADLTESTVSKLRRSGMTLILTDIDDEMLVEAARMLGVSLGSGPAFAARRPQHQTSRAAA